MKTGIVKTINLLVICIVLFVYQQQAGARAAEVEAYEEEKAAAERAWAEAEAAENAALEEDAAPGYMDGVYEGTGTGFGGDVVVSVTVEDGVISDVQVVSGENETPEYLEAAKALLEDIVKEQSAEVDTVTGATLSSNGILEGTRAALSLAEGGAS